MASIINVDKIAEATSGNGVQIPGHSIQTVSGTYSTAGSTTIWYSPAWLWSFTEAAGGTSQLTYSIYCWTQNAGQTTWWNDAYSNTEENPTSTMILTEIAQ